MALVSDPIRIGSSRLKNRLTFAPTVKFDWAEEDGRLGELQIAHYRERAAHGLGLLCVEATAVTPGGRFAPRHIGLWDDGQIDAHRAVTAACRENGVVSLIQLNHTGVTANPICGEAIGPSKVACRSGESRAMTVEEIHAMQRAFLDAALRAREAGYDGVQLHACHGYLINQFAARSTNLREDEYGGSNENRARFASEIIRAIRAACGRDFLISARISGTDPDLAGALEIGEAFVQAGCDYLQVSSGIAPPEEGIYDAAMPGGETCALGVRFHGHFRGRVPVSCVGGVFEPEQARRLVEEDWTDTVDLARAVLADPRFPEAVLRGGPYVRCMQCRHCQYGPFMKHVCPAEKRRRKEEEREA